MARPLRWPSGPIRPRPDGMPREALPRSRALDEPSWGTITAREVHARPADPRRPADLQPPGDDRAGLRAGPPGPPRAAAGRRGRSAGRCRGRGGALRAGARAVTEEVDWPCEVERDYADANLGCKRRVSTGVSWVFEQAEEAILLEDDCLPHPSFFRYCEELLERYRDDDRVMHISGDNLRFGRRGEASYFFSRYPHVWGWASWRRAWRHYDPDLREWTMAARQGPGPLRLRRCRRAALLAARLGRVRRRARSTPGTTSGSSPASPTVASRSTRTSTWSATSASRGDSTHTQSDGDGISNLPAAEIGQSAAPPSPHRAGRASATPRPLGGSSREPEPLRRASRRDSASELAGGSGRCADGRERSRGPRCRRRLPSP